MNRITTSDLRKMNNSEGLILQGCGGDLQEWIECINEELSRKSILLDGTQFKNVSSFEHDGTTCLLFPLKDVKIDVLKLSMWRLQTHQNFGGTWLTDYVPNRLGGFINENSIQNEKPDCPLIGADGNIFNLIGIASRTLKDNDMTAEATEMCERIRNSGSYNEALCILGEYVNITSAEDIDEDCGEGMEIEYK